MKSVFFSQNYKKKLNFIGFLFFFVIFVFFVFGQIWTRGRPTRTENDRGWPRMTEDDRGWPRTASENHQKYKKNQKTNSTKTTKIINSNQICSKFSKNKFCKKIYNFNWFLFFSQKSWKKRFSGEFQKSWKTQQKGERKKRAYKFQKFTQKNPKYRISLERELCLWEELGSSS